MKNAFQVCSFCNRDESIIHSRVVFKSLRYVSPFTNNNNVQCMFYSLVQNLFYGTIFLFIVGKLFFTAIICFLEITSGYLFCSWMSSCAVHPPLTVKFSSLGGKQQRQILCWHYNSVGAEEKTCPKQSLCKRVKKHVCRPKLWGADRHVFQPNLKQ